MTTTPPTPAADVELLLWSGCPSSEHVLEELRTALADAGLDPGAIRVRQVETDADAARERFVGSPTIRVDGNDPFPAGPDEPVGLSCRIYRLRDGRISPLPDPDDLRAALARAAANTTPERSNQ